MNWNVLTDYLHELHHKGVPGCELIVCQDHRILFHSCLGHSDEQRMRNASAQDRYWLYSCTKPVLAAAAMKAMEDGLFSLEEPVSKYLPAYRDAYWMQDGVRCPTNDSMTIRHLFTMTAGLDYNLKSKEVQDVQQATDHHATTVQIAEALARKPLTFKPGDHFQYSACLDVLGAVIESASRMTLRDYMYRNIFEPLGMTDTDFCTEGKPDRLAALYRYDVDTERVELAGWKNGFVLSPCFYSGGAGLVSTASDYILFADALACEGIAMNGARLLQKESIDLMRTPNLSSFDVTSQFSCTCGSDYGYGLGVRTRIASEYGVESAMGEFGWDGAAGADILVDPQHHLSMVYMQHVLNWPPMVGTIHLQIRDRLYETLFLS